MSLRSVRPSLVNVLSRSYTVEQQRCYALLWNPFKKSAVIDKSGTGVGDGQNGVVSPELVELRQRVRCSNDSVALGEVLRALRPLVDGSGETFITMSDVIKKLDKVSAQRDTADGEIVGDDKAVMIPGLSVEECYDLYCSVIDCISRDNYKSARFIPRLYLQLASRYEKMGDELMLSSVFGKFVQYLLKLGFEDQVLKVVKSFSGKDAISQSKLVESLVDVLASSDDIIHPTIISSLITILRDSKLVEIGVSKTADFLRSKEKSLFPIEKKDMEGIQHIVDWVSISSEMNDNMVLNTLQICSMMDGLVSTEEESLLKLLQAYKTTSEEVALAITSRAMTHTLLPVDAQLWIKQMEPFARLKLVWDIYLNGFDQQKIPQELIDQSTLNLAVLATINSKREELPKVLEFFSSNDVDFTQATFEILMNKYISTKDYESLQHSFTNSFKNGVDWTGNPILYRYLITMASQPEADVKEIFLIAKKIKIYLGYLNSESYNALMKLILQSEFIQDAVVSFKEELPPLDEGAKYTQAQYPSLYDTILQWCISEATYPEDIHKLYTEFAKKFVIPLDFYQPLIMRLTALHRPDFAFEIFQDMKRMHRTTGSIPPPPPEVYIHLFKSFGRDLYTDGVETLDAIYKTDLTINTSVPLLNSILDAYASLQDFTKVSQTYNKILRHPQGPDNETVSIMLKAQTFLSLDNVREFWNNLDDIGVLPNEDNYKRYIIAHCYHGEDKLAIDVAKSMEDMDVDVNENIVKTLYEWSEDKDNVEEWAKEEHEGIWNAVGDECKSLVVVDKADEAPEPGMTVEELRLVRS